MRDTDLYRKILGLEEPWKVTGVEADVTGGEVRVHVAHVASPPTCARCERECPRHDTRTRRWRHLDTCQLRTILVAEVPRTKCASCGILQVRVPWGEEHSRFTALFEAFVIDWARHASILAVAEVAGLSWDQVDGIVTRAVHRGLRRRGSTPGRSLPRHLGVDETSFQKRHEYVTVIMDRVEGTVIEIADGRSREVLDDFFEVWPDDQLEAVESVAMDMCGPYIAAVRDALPDADKKIAFDRFHVAMNLSKAVDQVRRDEHKTLMREGDATLKGTKYLWLKARKALGWHQSRELAALKACSLKTARAWAFKELAASLWRYKSRTWARKAWMRWYAWAIRSRLEPIKMAARMVKRHLEGILNAVVLGVTNARSEATNAKIQWIKYTGRGFRNRERFRNAIFFHCGGLDLYPQGVQRSAPSHP